MEGLSRRFAIFLCLGLVVVMAWLYLGRVDRGVAAGDRPEFIGDASGLGAVVSSPADLVQFTIGDNGIQPALVTVTLGTSVTWFNSTGVTQTLQSGDPYRVFLPVVLRGYDGANQLSVQFPSSPQAGNLYPASNGVFPVAIAPGGSFSSTFASEGSVSYFLAAAPQFSCRVVVRTPPATATPTATGASTATGAPTRTPTSTPTPLPTAVATVEPTNATTMTLPSNWGEVNLPAGLVTTTTTFS
ncbi:MAG: hypothetical protein Q7O66_22250 [Dehalococcoidia bacterium]|nr:hypothetical protein [Dehalococcoidia bacterium]